MITGSIVNGTDTPAGWASYFLDHAGALPGRPSAKLSGPPAHCSYARERLLAVGGFPEDLRAGEDTVVNRELFRAGDRAYRCQDLRLVHRSRCTSVGPLLRHHFQRGRGFGRILVSDHDGGARLLRARMLRSLLVGYVPGRMKRTRAQVEAWGGDLRPRYRDVRALVALGTLSAWAGIWFEILRPGRGKLAVLLFDQRRARDGRVGVSRPGLGENLGVAHPRDLTVREGGLRGDQHPRPVTARK
jgi:hypothetical protein